METDVLVVGAGAAGMTAALYALRNGKRVLVLEQETVGGQIASSPKVENFPSIPSISGLDFSNNLFEQITALGAEFELEKALEIERTPSGFRVATDFGSHTAKSVVLANGVKHKKLGLPNEDELTGRGISYCAICDGAFYAGREAALVGDGNTALQYAILLSNYCSKVTVFTLFDRFFGDDALVKTLLSKTNVSWRPNTRIRGAEPDGNDVKIFFTEQKDGAETEKSQTFPALFVAIGQVPDNERFREFAELDPNGYYASDESCTTKTPGVFVAGDCRAKKVRQLTTAAADGAAAALAACAYLDSLSTDASPI